jgi:Tfp pilus assembly protein PilF
MPTFITTKNKGILSKPFIHLLAIIFITFLIYSNTFNAPFQFDDAPNIVDNPAIKNLHYFSDPSRVENVNKSVGLNAPLFKTRYIGYLTFALNYRLHGLDVRGYHLVNIFIHMFNSLLLYWFITLTFKTPFFSVTGRHLVFPDGARNFIVVFTALLFAVHPIQTQAVTYIVQRFTSLATFFYLMSLVMYIKWKESKEQQPKRYVPSAMFYAVSLLSAVLAMKTKEFAFTLPVVMAMYELMFFNGKIMKRLLYLAPFFLTVLLIPLSLAVTGWSLSDISRINEEAANISGASVSISRGEYLFTQLRVIVTYIRLLFIPINQNIDYDYPIFRSFFSPSIVLSFLFLLSVIIAGIYLYRLSKRSETKDRFWLRLTTFGIFWFFIALFAESGVIPIRDVIFEHRVYLPSVGFFIALTAAIAAVREKWGISIIYAKKTILYVMITVILVLSGATYARNNLWSDSVRLWRDIVMKSPKKARPYNNLALILSKNGQVSLAEDYFKTALKINNDYIEPYFNLGTDYEALGKYEKAEWAYRNVLRINPRDAVAHNRLGVVYGNLKRYGAAEEEFRHCLQINPLMFDAWNNLGVLFEKFEQYQKAENAYRKTLEIEPNNSTALNNLGVLLGNQGRYEEALKIFQKALSVNPNDQSVQSNLKTANELMLNQFQSIPVQESD